MLLPRVIALAAFEDLVSGGVSRRGWMLFAAMCVIWGIPYLLIRVAVRDLSPATVVCVRTGIGALVLLPVAVRRGRLRALHGHWPWLLTYTMVEVAGPWLLLSSAEVHLTSALAGLLVAGVPLVGVVVNRIAGTSDVVSGRRLFGLLLGLGGVVALVGLQLGQISLVAVAEIGVVAIGYATGPVIISRRLTEPPGIAVVAVSLGVTALIYAPFAATSHRGHISGEIVASLIVLSLICTAVAFLVFFALIAEVGPARATVITYVNPAVAIVLGVGLLGEHFTVGMAVGFPLILLGSVLATASSRRGQEPLPVAEGELARTE